MAGPPAGRTVSREERAERERVRRGEACVRKRNVTEAGFLEAEWGIINRDGGVIKCVTGRHNGTRSSLLAEANTRLRRKVLEACRKWGAGQVHSRRSLTLPRRALAHACALASHLGGQERGERPGNEKPGAAPALSERVPGAEPAPGGSGLHVHPILVPLQFPPKMSNRGTETPSN